MPYTKSRSRKQFEEVNKGLRILSRKSSFKRNKVDYDIQQGVFKNCLFETSAVLEVYIKSIFEDWIYLLHTNNLAINSVPVELVYWTSGINQVNAYKRYFIGGDENKLVKDLINDRLTPKIYDCETKASDVIHKTKSISDRKYPSVANIKAITKRHGIKNFFAEVNRLGSKDYKIVLDSFLDKRTELAHNHPTPNITLSDVLTHLSNINDFVTKADRVIYKHICRCSNSSCWNSA